MPTAIDPDCGAREATEAEKAQAARIKDANQETRSMAIAFAALVPLGYNARKRTLRWLADALEDAEAPF